MKVLITGAHTREAYMASENLLNESTNLINLVISGRNHSDLAILLSNYGLILDSVGKEIEYVKENKFTHVLPFADFTQWALAKEELSALEIKVIVNPFESLRIVNDYFELFKKCREDNIIHPRTYRGNTEINYFPLAIKSRDKKELYIAKDMRDVYNFTSGRKDVLVQQHIIGKALTVIFGKNWQVCSQWMGEHTLEIINKCPIDLTRIIESLGLSFGSLTFVVKEGVEYFVDAMPYIDWRFLGNDTILKNLLVGESLMGFGSGYRITEVPSVI